MKNILKKFRLEIIFEAISVFVISILVFRIMSRFSTNSFLFDDNRSQWLPIMDSAFDTFFKQGYLPFIDFYQMKGMNILDVGFYSLINPFMWIAYIFKNIFLDSQKWNTISVYIYIMFGLGNMFVFYIFKNLKLKKLYSIPLLFCYATSTCYVFLGYWYYVFNTYMLMPLMILIIIKYHKKKSIYYMIGILFAVSIYMGNLQYTIYQYIAIGIILFILSVKNNKEYIKIFLSNIVISIMLGWPQLVMAIRASKNASDFSAKINPNFFAYPLNPIKFLLGGIIPVDLLKRIPLLSNILENVKPINQEYWGGIEFYFIGGLLICFYICIIIYARNCTTKGYGKDNENPDKRFFEDMTLATIITIIFFILFMFGDKFFIAKIMSVFPVIKSLRFLHKIIIIIPPLLIIPAAYVFKSNIKTELKEWIIVICLVVGVLGIGNYNIGGQKPMDYETTRERLSSSNIDIKNYRVITFLEYDEKNFFIEVSQDMEKKIIRNTSTPLKVFSLGGYNINYDKITLDQSDMFLKYAENFSSFSYINGVNSKEFFEKVGNDYSLKKRVYDQINKNSIKYFLFKSDSIYTNQFISLMNESNEFKVVRVDSFIDNYNIIEIENVSSLCNDKKNSKVPMESSMGKLNFKIDNKDEIVSLQFTFNNKYKARFISEDGKNIKDLEINKTDDGYMKIMVSGLGKGSIEIYYYDVISYLAVVFSILTIVLLGLLIIIKYFRAFFPKDINNIPKFIIN